MSAVPENISSIGRDPRDTAMVNTILASAHNGLVVLVDSAPGFDASIHSLLAPSLQEFSNLENKVPGNLQSLRPEKYPLLVLHTTSLGLAVCERILEAIPALVPVVLMHDQGSTPPDELQSEQVVANICNDQSAGQSWQDFSARRDENYGNLIVLDFMDKQSAVPLQTYLTLRHFQVVTAGERLATTFGRSHVGSQLLVIEAGAQTSELVDYIYRLRLSHESDVLGILLNGEVTDQASRCSLLEAGADDLVDAQMSNAELVLRLQSLASQQTRAQQIRGDAYRFPGSVAYNADFLVNVGNKLYASAQRDVMTMALAMVRVGFVQTDSSVKLSRQERVDVLQLVANYCSKNLRETDLFAQCGERDFIALVTCVGRNNIARVFSRLSEEVIELVDRSTKGKATVKLVIGATPELGVSFKSMMTRAQQALVKAEKEPENWLIIN